MNSSLCVLFFFFWKDLDHHKELAGDWKWSLNTLNIQIHKNKPTDNKTVDTPIPWLVVVTEIATVEMLDHHNWEALGGKDSCSDDRVSLGEICMSRNG